MFVNSDYLDYKYLVSASDNYVVLSNQHSANGTWQDPDEIDVIYQYFYPSTLTIESTRSVSNYSYYEQVNVTDDYWERADCPIITCAGFMNLAFILFIINATTRLVRKGGILFGKG